MGVLQKEFGEDKIWVNYQLKEVKGKMTKVPYAMDSQKASSTDPAGWGSYAEARLRSDKIGIVFAGEVMGIDIDKCLEEGKLKPEYREEIANLILTAGTYTEISPSGTGLHLYFRLKETITLLANKKAPYEVYTSGRYFTVTETPYGLEEDVRAVNAEEIAEILSVIGYPWGKTKTKTTEIIKELKTPLADEELLARMFRAKNGEAVKKLYDGDASQYGNDLSNADMALCSHLAFWARKDGPRIERLWMQSPLGQREKTQSREDYRKRTVNGAIDLTGKVYEGPEQRAVEKLEKEEELDLLFTMSPKKEVIFTQNTENICRILRKSKEFKSKVRFDSFKNVTEFHARDGWRDIMDVDVVEVQTTLSIQFPQFAKVGKQMVEDAMNLVARENEVDSAADYMKALVWDGEKRLDSWLHHTYNVADDEYHQSVGSNWMKGLVKRIIHPGCKFDYVLVLEGEQGIKKSTSLSVLGGEWYVETTMSTDSKDFFMQFQGKSIVEFSEGETLSRTEVKRMKAIITTSTDKYRPAYGRFSIDFPRRCVFAMTTNQDEYLKDETGNRRWLPVACNGVANVEWLANNRNQLFAEAYQRVIVDQETTWEFPEDLMKEAQEARRVHDPYEDVIADWYVNTISQYDREEGITTKQAFDDAYNASRHGKFDKYTEMQIANILKNSLKLDKRRKMLNGIQSMRWFMTADTPRNYDRQEPVSASEKLEAVYNDF